MRKAVFMLFVLSILFLSSCNGHHRESEKPSTGGTVFYESILGNEECEEAEQIDIGALVNAYKPPVQSTEEIIWQEIVDNFPEDIIQQIKIALIENRIQNLFDILNDNSLIVEFGNIESQLQFCLTEESNGYEQRVYNLFYSEHPIRYNTEAVLYSLDLNNDGNEEIIIIENSIEPDDRFTMLHIFKKNQENYVYRKSFYINYNQYNGIFSSEGAYYLITHQTDFETKATSSIELYILDDTILDDDLYPIDQKEPYLKKNNGRYLSVKKSVSDFYVESLHKKNSLSITDGVVSYIEEIIPDLIYTDRIYKYFYGDEIFEKDSLAEQYKDNKKYKNSKPLFSADVNNEGIKELFIRYNIFEHYISYPETTLVWCQAETLQEYIPENIEFWSHPEFLVTQRWFKEIEGKTISFSLYRKKETDVYLLDARMFEAGEVIILADYMFYPEYEAYVTEPQSLFTNNTIEKSYKSDSVFEILPDLEERINRFSLEKKDDFLPVYDSDNHLPDELVNWLEQVIYEDKLDILADLALSMNADKELFFQTYGLNGDEELNFIFRNKDLYDKRVESIASYKIDEVQYYFLVLNQKTGYKNNYIYREEDGTLFEQKSWLTENYDRWVIPFADRYYLVEAYYIPYNHSADKFIDRLFVTELNSNKIDKYTVIAFMPKQFYWGEVYCAEPNEKLSIYVEGIKSNLTKDLYVDRETSFYHQQLPTFTGDETEAFDWDRRLRLQSVNGYTSHLQSYFILYEINYNNDNIPNYLNRYHVGYSLFCKFYDIIDNRTFQIETNLSNSSDGEIVQLWFKEINGTVYTFKLYWFEEYSFYLTASVIKGNEEKIQQVYMISPDRAFIIYEFFIDQD